MTSILRNSQEYHAHITDLCHNKSLWYTITFILSHSTPTSCTSQPYHTNIMLHHLCHISFKWHHITSTSRTSQPYHSHITHITSYHLILHHIIPRQISRPSYEYHTHSTPISHQITLILHNFHIKLHHAYIIHITVISHRYDVTSHHIQITWISRPYQAHNSHITHISRPITLVPHYTISRQYHNITCISRTYHTYITSNHVIYGWVNQGTIVVTGSPSGKVFDEPTGLRGSRTHDLVAGSPTL